MCTIKVNKWRDTLLIWAEGVIYIQYLALNYLQHLQGRILKSYIPDFLDLKATNPNSVAT